VSRKYDALLIVSFGGPEGPDEVMPFLENVTRGRDIPPARLAEVAERYYTRGGISPINQANRELRDALSARLEIPVYWGNRNWHPFLADTVRDMRDDGVQHALAFITSVFASYSSCRQYLENIAAAREAVGDGAPTIDRLRHGFDHPAFIEAFTDTTVAAIDSLPMDVRDTARLVFTAHSIPLAMAAASGPNGGLYEAQLAAAAALIADGVETRTGVRPAHDLVYQSRSGRPDDQWLEPDLARHIGQVDASAVVVVPLGFTADHMEVVFDIDVEAADRARSRGLPFARAATPGTHPAYVDMIDELVRERTDPSTPRRALSSLGPSYDECPANCCLDPGVRAG
jgi:ferrochelatase